MGKQPRKSKEQNRTNQNNQSFNDVKQNKNSKAYDRTVTQTENKNQQNCKG